MAGGTLIEDQWGVGKEKRIRGIDVVGDSQKKTCRRNSPGCVVFEGTKWLVC